MRDVAFSCDDNGVPFLKVSVWSLLAHYKGEASIRVNVFEGWGGHSAAHKAELAEIVGRFPKATLRYVNVEAAVAPYADVIMNREKSRWNVFTWTPIFTPQLLPDATGNVIHFDIDMLFNADVDELFELDLARNDELGITNGGRVDSLIKEDADSAIPHSSFHIPHSQRPYLIACTYEYDKYGENAGRVVWEKGILPPTVERYFNTGVLVFNAEACRAERTWEKIVAWYKAHYDIADRIEQDAWNALYHDRMLPLHVKWNFHDRAIKNYAKWPLYERYWLGNLPYNCLTAALEPSLLHFWGPKKPWKTSHRPYRKLYHAAMRAVGQTVPREPLLAPFYDWKNALDLRRIAKRRPLVDPANREEILRRAWTSHRRKQRVKAVLLAPFEWLGIALGLLVFASLPHRALLAVCDFCSAVFYRFDRRGRARALENLHIVMGACRGDEGTPGFNPDRAPFAPTPREARILRRAYRNMARTIGHIFWTLVFARRRAAAVGEMCAEAKAFLRANRPAVTVSGHIGCWEILSQLAFLEGHPMMSVAKRIGTDGMTRLLMKARKSIGQEIVSAEGAFKPLMAGLKAGKSLGLLVDQSVDPKDGGIWVRFFGRPIPVSAAPAFFAAKAKAAIVVAWSRPLHDGRYRCEVVDTIAPDEARDVWATTQRCARDLERVIRRHPSCWAMNYNFFSNIPTDADLTTLAEREGKGQRT